MKKIVIALMCTILATGAAMAQEKFTFGPKIGVDYTHYWGENVEHGGHLNYQAGVFMECRFTSKFSIAPEVVFAAQGGKYDFKRNIEGIDVELKETDHVNYINVPVMLKYYVAPALSIDFGPQLGFNVYSKNTIEGKVEKLKEKETTDMKKYTKTVDFGLGLGLTYNITEEVFIQARYTMGLTKVFNVDDDSKNGNGQIAIGFRF
ncbi:MAG: PorT family protein [Muribaculaceae bacterium]|nr:PorT family protein [Muribaculaceae bacterium]